MSDHRFIGEIEFKWTGGKNVLIEEVLDQSTAWIRVRGYRCSRPAVYPLRAVLHARGEWTFTWRTIDEIKWRVSLFTPYSNLEVVELSADDEGQAA